MEEKNIGLIYGISNNERVCMVMSDKISAIEIHNDTYLKFHCPGITIIMEYKGIDVKKLLFDLSAFLLDPSEFNNLFFIKVNPKEVLGIDLKEE